MSWMIGLLVLAWFATLYGAYAVGVNHGSTYVLKRLRKTDKDALAALLMKDFEQEKNRRQ
jgi:hypothetical protein